jgi:hypothetical protein
MDEQDAQDGLAEGDEIMLGMCFAAASTLLSFAE